MSAKRSIIPVFVPHLGCPNNCVFCNQKHISGQAGPATEKTVTNALSNAENIGLALSECELAFYGGSFTAIPEEDQRILLNAAQRLVKAGGCLRLSTRPDCIDEHILKMLKAYGVQTIELGCQSMDDEVLRLSGRGHTAQQIKTAAKLVRQFGFSMILQMMTGLPGDTKEKSIETANKLCKLDPDGVRIYPTVIIRDTPLCDMWRDGSYPEHTVEQAADWCAHLVPIFENAHVPIIRLGLNPSDELSGGQALGGAYHPAFGEIVYSRMYFNRAVEMLNAVHDAKNVILYVNPKSLSQMTGQKKCNLTALREKYPELNIRIAAKDSVAIREIYIEKS